MKKEHIRYKKRVILLLLGILLAGCSQKTDETDEIINVISESEETVAEVEETTIYSGPAFEGNDDKDYEGFSHLFKGTLWDDEGNRYDVYIPGEEESSYSDYWIDKEYLGVHFQMTINPYYEDENDSLEKKLNDYIELFTRIDSYTSVEYRDYIISEPELVKNGVRVTVEYCLYDDIWQKYDSVFETYYLRELKTGELVLIQTKIDSSDIQENTEELIWELEQFYQFDINWDRELAQQKSETCKENSQTNPYRLEDFSFALPIGWKGDITLGNKYSSMQVYAPNGEAKDTGCLIAVYENSISNPEVEKMNLLAEHLSEEAVEKILGMDISGYESKVAETTLGKTVIISYEIENEENCALVTICTAACMYDVITIVGMEKPDSEYEVEPALNLILENSSYPYEERVPVEEELEKVASTEKAIIEEELNGETVEKKYLSKSFIENNFVVADDIKAFFEEEGPEPVIEVIGRDREVIRERYVFAGEYLKSIAAEVYGNQDKWIDIYEANKELLGDRPELIYEGQYLILPHCNDVSYANVNTCYDNTVENIISWEGITEYIAPNCGYGIQNAIFYYTLPESEGESFMICYPRLISYNGKDVTAVNDGIRECAMKYVDSLLINRSEEFEYELRTNEFYSLSGVRSNVNYVISYLDENTISVVFQDDVQEGYIHNYDMRTYVADINTGIRYENEELWGISDDMSLAEMIQADCISQQNFWDQELFSEEIPIEFIHDLLQTNGYVERSYLDTFLTENGVGFAITYRTTQMRGWTKIIMPREKTTSYQANCVIWKNT